MARYSVATTKDNLSSLIDKALAGEEVIITRHGKPIVALHALEKATATRSSKTEALEKLRTIRESLPVQTVSYLDLKKLDEAEGAL